MAPVPIIEIIFHKIKKINKILYIIFQGAQILANQVAVVINDLEEKRVDYIKLQNKMKREKDNNVKAFKV